MRALQLVQAPKPPELREVPEPGPGQVLVKVGGAGACHSHQHPMAAPRSAWGWCPSHSATRTRGGSKARPRRNRFTPGDPVIVYGPWG